MLAFAWFYLGIVGFADFEYFFDLLVIMAGPLVVGIGVMDAAWVVEFFIDEESDAVLHVDAGDGGERDFIGATAEVWVIAVDEHIEGDDAFLEQVEEGDAAAHVGSGDLTGQAQVGFDHSLAGCDVALLGQPHQPFYLIFIQWFMAVICEFPCQKPLNVVLPTRRTIRAVLLHKILLALLYTQNVYRATSYPSE